MGREKYDTERVGWIHGRAGNAKKMTGMDDPTIVVNVKPHVKPESP